MSLHVQVMWLVENIFKETASEIGFGRAQETKPQLIFPGSVVTAPSKKEFKMIPRTISFRQVQHDYVHKVPDILLHDLQPLSHRPYRPPAFLT